MTQPFWTPEKKKDYLNLIEQRERSREYMRNYMGRKRDNGEYKYFKLNGKVKYEKICNQSDEKNRQRTG